MTLRKSERSRRHLKKFEKHHAEKRAALMQSINTAEDFQHILKLAVKAMGESPHLDRAALHTMQCILLRGHQVLIPETFWGILERMDISRHAAQKMIDDEIKERTAQSINAPFSDYMDEICRRAIKLARGMKAGKYNQDIYKLRSTALYREYQQLEEAWNAVPGRPEDITVMFH